MCPPGKDFQVSDRILMGSVPDSPRRDRGRQAKTGHLPPPLLARTREGNWVDCWVCGDGADFVPLRHFAMELLHSFKAIEDFKHAPTNFITEAKRGVIDFAKSRRCWVQ